VRTATHDETGKPCGPLSSYRRRRGKEKVNFETDAFPKVKGDGLSRDVAAQQKSRGGSGAGTLVAAAKYNILPIRAPARPVSVKNHTAGDMTWGEEVGKQGRQGEKNLPRVNRKPLPTLHEKKRRAADRGGKKTNPRGRSVEL